MSGLGCGDLEELRAFIGDCRRCPLAEHRTHLVFGVGDPHARVMFIGEGPGLNEDLQGEPFVGAAGRLLAGLLGELGACPGAGLHRERREVPAAGQPRPGARRDRELRAAPFSVRSS